VVKSKCGGFAAKGSLRFRKERKKEGNFSGLFKERSGENEDGGDGNGDQIITIGR